MHTLLVQNDGKDSKTIRVPQRDLPRFTSTFQAIMNNKRD